MGANYTLNLSADLKSTSDVESKLKQKMAEWQAKGLTQIKVRYVLDKDGIKKATASVRDASGNLQRYGATLNKTTGEVKELDYVTEGATESTNGFSRQMLQSIKSAAQYALSIGIVYKALQQLQDGVQYIKDLDKEMRNVQIVAGYTDETIQGLAVQYNSLAKEMGATTLEVASGSLEWVRQGKTIEETQELLQSTLMLSKLGNVDAADATEYLTSILNGFKLEAKDSVGVVDKLVAIDNAAATSVEEMAVAFQKSAVSAQAAGVDLETLAAYVGTVSSVTRLSAETVGTSLIF